MATIAFIFGFTVLSTEMTFFALCGGVHADERETGKVVVEQNITMPAFFVMAAVALFALFAFVNIIFLVAVDTFRP